MTIFLLSPLLVGLAVPFIAGQYYKSVVKKSVAALMIFMFALALFLIALSLIYGAPLINALKLCIFLYAFGTSLAGGFYLLAIISNAKVSQLVISLIVVAMVGTIFYFNPIIQRFEEAHSDSAKIAGVCNIALAVNPYAVVSGSIFGIDFIRENKYLYNNSHIAYYIYRYPDWKKVVLSYIVFSAVSFGLVFIIKSLRKSYGR